MRHIRELSDPTPLRASPYRCAPPKLAVFREMVNKLLEQEVVRPRKSPYASPAFLVPKNGAICVWWWIIGKWTPK